MMPDEKKSNFSNPVMDVQRPRNTILPKTVTAENFSNATNNEAQYPNQPLSQQNSPDISPSNNMPRPTKKKRTGLIIMIITIGAILLIGVGVTALIVMQNNNTPEITKTTAKSTAGRVDVADIDTALNDIDKTLNTLNDSSDVTANDVTDASLGL